MGVGGAVDLRTMPERRSRRTSALLLDALGERAMASKSCPHSLRWVGFFLDSPTTENLNAVSSWILHFFLNNNLEKVVGRYTQILTASPGVFQGNRRWLAVGATCA